MLICIDDLRDFIIRTDELMLEMFKVCTVAQLLALSHLEPPRQHVVAQSKVDPGLVGDICVGTVLTPDATYHARGAALAAGFPESVPIQTINRFCSSGLMAVRHGSFSTPLTTDMQVRRR